MVSGHIRQQINAIELAIRRHSYTCCSRNRMKEINVVYRCALDTAWRYFQRPLGHKGDMHSPLKMGQFPATEGLVDVR